MQDGNVFLPYKHFLGYRKGEDGRPEIVEDEAEIVRKIYSLFLSGRTIRYIADYLTDCEIPTPSGKAKWSVSTIKSILSNEKYRGDALLMKTYTVDYLTKEKRKNNGEVRQFLVENSHDPIIEPEIFDQVQERLNKHCARRSKIRSSNPFANRIICGDCGEFYGHKVWHNRNNTRRYDVWYCNHRYDEKCQTPVLHEDEIKAAFMAMLSKTGAECPEYSEESWRALVDNITVFSDRRMVFKLLDGKDVVICV